MGAGIDPGEHRKAVKAAKTEQAANSFEVIAREWYSKHSPNWSANHGDRIICRLQGDIFSWLGALPIVEIDALQLLEVIRRIEQRGALETAHRALSNCGQVFRYAVATGRAGRDPTGDLKDALQPAKGTHFAAVTDPKKVAGLLRALDTYAGTLTVRCGLRLAPLVFVRPGELRHAQWTDIDLVAAQWRFTVSKIDTEHIVPLAQQSVAILSELYPLTGRGRYVFPSARNPKGYRPMSDNAIPSVMRAMASRKER